MATLGDLMDLRGRRVLVTGAAGHLGGKFADTLAEMGAALVLVDLPGTPLEARATDLARRWNVGTHALDCDLESQDDRARLVAAVREGGGLDVLINNAAFVGTSGLQGWAVPFAQQSLDTWRRAMEVNLTAAFDLCQQFADLLRASPGGSVINVGSIYGELGPDWRLYKGTAMSNPAAYAASKGGLLQLTRWLATTLAPQVRVNSLCPGGISRGQPAAFVERYVERTPLARMAGEDDFRGAIAYLASDLSKYVTGQNLAVDGGWSAW